MFLANCSDFSYEMFLLYHSPWLNKDVTCNMRTCNVIRCVHLREEGVPSMRPMLVRNHGQQTNHCIKESSN